MKKRCLFFVVVFLSLAAAAQDTTGLPRPTRSYTSIAKSQKTAAWVLTGAGTTGLFVTLVADMAQTVGGAVVSVISLGSVQPDYKSYAVSYVLSGAAVVGGIALFTASARTKRKARNVSTFVDMRELQLVHGSGVIRQSIPTAGVKVRL